MHNYWGYFEHPSACLNMFILSTKKVLRALSKVFLHVNNYENIKELIVEHS